MRLLTGAGLRGIDAALRVLTRSGLPLTLSNRQRGLRTWAGQLSQQKAELRITVTSNRLIRTTHVTWYTTQATALTRHQQERKRTHDAFYARYLAAGQRAYAPHPGRLARADRWILLIGEFEADVNNGGLRQFVENKGRAKARVVLRICDAIGAPKTGRLLRSAVRASVHDLIWDGLDRQFTRTGEDLPMATMRHLRLIPTD
jgi:hypothetical protein